MGKTVLVIIIIAAAGLVFYLQTRTPVSAEVLKVKAIEDAYTATVSRITGAGGSGVQGLDVTDAAVSQIQKLRADIKQLRAALTEEKALRRADELQAKIAEFCRKNDIN